MVLLHAAATVGAGTVRGVATFDHGTGAHATAAVEVVRAVAAAYELPFVTARAGVLASTEAAWREARWRFLTDARSGCGARAIATAHTRDDQIETVAMRVLRGAGPRGVAAMAAHAPGVVRPLLDVSRADVAAYAARHRLRWVEDPGNADRRHLRTRVRSEVLPAFERVRPGLATRLGAAGDEAAPWREEVDAWVRRVVEWEAAGRAPRVDPLVLAELSPEALAAFWPAFAALGGVRLDRRAVVRLVAFTARAAERVRAGRAQPARVPVAGGRVVELVHVGGWRLVVPPVP